MTRETPCSRVVTTRYDKMVAALDLASRVSVVVHSGASSRLQRSGCTHCQESALARSSDGTCKQKGAPLARGLVALLGKCLGPLPMLSATPKDRYSRLRPLRPAAGVVRQKSDFRGGPSFAFTGIVLGAAPQTTFPLAAKLGPPRITPF